MPQARKADSLFNICLNAINKYSLELAFHRHTTCRHEIGNLKRKIVNFDKDGSRDICAKSIKRKSKKSDELQHKDKDLEESKFENKKNCNVRAENENSELVNEKLKRKYFSRTVFCKFCLTENIGIMPMNIPSFLSKSILDVCRTYLTTKTVFNDEYESICHKIGHYIFAFQTYLFLHPETTEIRHYLCNAESITRSRSESREIISEVMLEMFKKRCRKVNKLSITALKSRSVDISILLQLNSYIQVLGNSLQELTINAYTNVGDDTITILAEFCPTLMKLDIKMCKRVTDDGMSILAGDKRNVGCKNLEVLYIDGTGVTSRGMMVALSHLKKLKILHGGNGTIGYPITEILDKYAEENISNELNLTELELTMHGTSQCTQVENILKICPSVNKLGILINRRCTITSLSNLKKLTKLSLWINLRWYDPGLEVLKFIGYQLTEFEMEYCNTLDLSLIVAFCPNLEVLSIENRLRHGHHAEIKYLDESKENACKKLKKLELSDTVSRFANEALLKIILQNAVLLEKLQLLCVECFSARVISEATIYNRFKCLKELVLGECPNLGKEGLLTFLELDNPLNRLFVNRCGLEESEISEVRKYSSLFDFKNAKLW